MFLSNAYIAQKKYAESEKLFLPLAQKGMMQAQYLLALGYYHVGNLKEAEKWAKKTLENLKENSQMILKQRKKLLNRINSKLKELNKNKGMVKIMKKVLIGLFLVASLSVLGAKNQTLDIANYVKKGKYFLRQRNFDLKR